MTAVLIIAGAVALGVVVLFWILRGDTRTPKKDQGFAFCSHCGAVWDSRHEQGGCSVMGATNRILGASDEEAAELQRDHRHGLRETANPVSGRAGT